MSEATPPESTLDELEQRLEAVVLVNLREEMEVAALYESVFGAEFKGLKQIRDELLSQETVRRIERGVAPAQLARQLGVDRSTVHRWIRHTPIGSSANTTIPSSSALRVQRQEEAWRRREEGETYRAISESMEVSMPTLFRWIAALRKSREAADV